MSHPSRPTFDPVLPHKSTKRLRAHTDKLIPASVGQASRPTWRQAAFVTATGGVSAAVLALLSTSASAVLLAVLCLGITTFVLAVIANKGALADDWADLVMHSFWALPVGVTGVFTSKLLLDQALGPLNTALPGDATTAVLYLTAAVGGAGTIMRPGNAARLASENYDRYVLPEDFGRPYSYATRQEEPEAHLFGRLQQATDRVEEGARVLGQSFDTSHTLPLLRDEEWRLSQELLHLRSLRKELVQRKREAVSEQVTRALAPQEEAVTRAHDALAERVRVLTGYGERVHAAVTAHREWEQCQAIADRADAYADLALSSAEEAMPAEELDDSLLSVEAAHTVREELVREAVDAGSSLTDALYPREGGERD